MLSLVAVAAASITDCDPTSLFRPTKLALNPDPPVRGQPVLMTVELNNPGAPVTDGSVTTSVTLNGIPFSPSTEPLCKNTVCPIVTGWNDRSATSTWPTTVSGKVVSKSQWISTTGERLLCIQTSVKVASDKHLRHYHYEEIPEWVWGSGNSTATGTSSGGSSSGGSKSGGSSSGGSSGSSSSGGNSTSSGASTASGSGSGSGSGSLRCVNCLVVAQ